MNPSTALAAVLVDELARCGLAHAVIAPGSRSTPLALALHDHQRIRIHVDIDERSAAFCALGIAKATGIPAAVLCTSGTAAANLHPAVIEAHQSRVPLLILTADRPPELRDTGANQTVDQIKLYGTAVRWFCDVGDPPSAASAAAYWRSVGARAAAEAAGLSGPPGPVHLNLPLREPLVGAAESQVLEGRSGGAPWTRTTPIRRRAPEAAQRLARQVSEVERGLVVAGDGAGSAAIELAERAGWPLLAEPLSGARSGANAIGAYDLILRTDPFARRHRPDLVVRAGSAVLSKALLGYLDPGIRQVLVDRHGAWLDPGRALAEIVVADLSEVVDALGTARRRSDWLDAWQRAEQRAADAIDRLLAAEATPTEPRTARDLAAHLPDGATLVAASSLPVRDLNQFMRPRRGLRVLGNRGASGIDGFVSTALGAALALSAPTYALAGDLSVLHDQNGFLLSERPDLVVVVVNNDGGGIFSFLPQAELPDAFERLFATPHGVDLENLARLYGLGHRRLERADDLTSMLDDAASQGGVQLIEVRTDRAANVELHRRLETAVISALEG